MCGIVGYTGPNPCVEVLLDGLRRLEYRGYDSAGVAVVGPGGLAVQRSKGKLQNLVGLLAEHPLDGLPHQLPQRSAGLGEAGVRGAGGRERR